jgi:hypothetical protein
MGHWNYRVIKKIAEDGTPVYQIHEVYYDDNGNREGWTEDPVLLYGEYLDELREDIQYFLQAFRQPIFEIRRKEIKKN